MADCMMMAVAGTTQLHSQRAPAFSAHLSAILHTFIVTKAQGLW
jgi:hypothetical protein